MSFVGVETLLPLPPCPEQPRKARLPMKSMWQHARVSCSQEQTRAAAAAAAEVAADSRYVVPRTAAALALR